VSKVEQALPRAGATHLASAGTLLVMHELLVAADDRTGALEVAGHCAAVLGPVLVVPAGTEGVVVTGGRSRPATTVVDLQSRYMDAAAAGRAAVSIDDMPARWVVHKMDSTLRGNWAHEVVARHRASGWRVLVVASFPQLGRVCRNGVVTEHGVLIGAGDARSPERSPRPADHLRSAGAAVVSELANAQAIEAWERSGSAFAVCDATTVDDLAAIGRAWASATGVLLVGTAGSIGAAMGALAERASIVVHDGPEEATSDPALQRPVLLVCGSLHPMARAQIDEVRATDSTVAVLTSPVPARLPVSDLDAAAAAVALAADAHRFLAGHPVATMVIIGGDTAAAVLGDGARVVGGTVASGMPWSYAADGSGPLVVTRAGGFGGPTALVALFRTRTARETG
jgi:uncharacterized protein YgbK (DUF1537 family)